MAKKETEGKVDKNVKNSVYRVLLYLEDCPREVAPNCFEMMSKKFENRKDAIDWVKENLKEDQEYLVIRHLNTFKAVKPPVQLLLVEEPV